MRPAEGTASQSSTVPFVDPSQASRGSRQKQGVLVEPPVARPAISRRPAGDMQAPTQASAAPNVHVTIGRIELRAAAPAAAPAFSRSDAARPALTLTDYLERRNATGAR